MSGNKILNYTGLSFDAIREQVEEFLKRDPRFSNMTDSSIAKTVFDVFSAMTDFTNYMIERRAEETYFETAKLKSSNILLSRNLGYVPTRPIPAKSAINIILRGPIPSGVVAGDTVSFQKHLTTFTGLGNPFILRFTYVYTFTSTDITNGFNNPNYEKTITKAVSLSGTSDTIPLDATGSVDSSVLIDIEILQGELKTETIFGGSNTQVSKIFQQYNISDKKISNLFGEEDEGYNKNSEQDEIVSNLTKIEINTSASADFTDTSNLFTIRRKSLVNPNDRSLEGIPSKSVLVRTSLNEGIDLTFGDDKIAEVGARSSSDNIHFQYLSTEGSKGNKVGIIGNDLQTPATFFTSNSVDVTNNITFKFAKNISFGSDLETTESMKINAPEIFYSLDRLVTKRDYVSYLKTQTIGNNGEKIKNALAWGEQEEVRERNQNANFRFFNVGFFCVIGPLYKFPVGGTNNILNDSELESSYLEEADDFSTVSETQTGVVSADGYPEQAYFNLFVKEVPRDMVQILEEYRDTNPSHPIFQMYDKLETRSQLTLKHIYVTPIVQKFKLKGNVTIGKLEDRTSVQRNLNNTIYSYLNENADFNSKIYLSTMTDILQNSKSVKNSSIYLEAVKPDQLITVWADDIDMTSGPMTGTSASIVTIFDDRITEYLTSAGYAKIYSTINPLSINESLATSSTYLSGGTSGIWNSNFSNPFYFEDKQHKRVDNINERTFYTGLMKKIYDDLTPTVYFANDTYTPFRESQFFKNIMYKMHNDLVHVIRTSMIDSEDNITIYSLKNEIVQVEISLNYKFDS